MNSDPKSPEKNGQGNQARCASAECKCMCCGCQHCNCERCEGKEIFKIALFQRNFEIQMFWQRCNYFLLLNSAVGAGAISTAAIKDIPIIFVAIFCAIGAGVCIAWIAVGLGAKYWQSYWEQATLDFQEYAGLISKRDEKEFVKINNGEIKFTHRNLFSRKVDHINERVKVFLGKYDKKYKKQTTPNKKFTEFVDNKCPPVKPSVSGWMRITAYSFFLIWLIACIVGLFLWKHGCDINSLSLTSPECFLIRSAVQND